jgi:2-polyprenyl-3-methyl-5-hydroxy-6-metoxy-1,4-benzoquinol methylase
VEVERVERCPICGGDGRAPLHRAVTDGVYGVAPGTWDLHRCTTCGGAFLDPRPTQATIGEAYATYYTHAAPQAEAPSHGLRRAIRNGYVNARYGYALKPANPLGRAVVPLVPPLRIDTDRLFRHLPKGARVLDVGCGNGDWVAQAQSVGWQADGIDPDEEAVAAARQAGLHVTTQSLHQLTGPYDAITLSHVIEHVPDPRQTLEAVHALLRPGGTIWLATPNLASIGHRVFGRHWRGLEAPRHLVLFDAPALRHALASAGFTHVEQHRTPPRARFMFTQSASIAAGRLPYDDPVQLPTRIARRATVADAFALVAPTTGEELVLSARR